MSEDKRSYRFVDYWDEDTNISWQKESRKRLNEAITLYNDWQIEHDFDPEKSVKVLAKIEYGKQTYGNIDGGSGYLEELEKMESFVKDYLEENN